MTPIPPASAGGPLRHTHTHTPAEWLQTETELFFLPRRLNPTDARLSAPPSGRGGRLTNTSAVRRPSRQHWWPRFGATLECEASMYCVLRRFAHLQCAAIANDLAMRTLADLEIDDEPMLTVLNINESDGWRSRRTVELANELGLPPTICQFQPSKASGLERAAPAYRRGASWSWLSPFICRTHAPIFRRPMA